MGDGMDITDLDHLAKRREGLVSLSTKWIKEGSLQTEKNWGGLKSMKRGKPKMQETQSRSLMLGDLGLILVL